jgi:RNA recognition motif-containing protein
VRPHDAAKSLRYNNLNLRVKYLSVSIVFNQTLYGLRRSCTTVSSPLSEIAVTIYVGNLSFQASEEDVKEIFAEYGTVSRVSLPMDRETGRKRGFAFVDLSSDAEEDAAIAELDGAEWLGRELKVNKAKPREPR